MAPDETQKTPGPRSCGRAGGWGQGGQPAPLTPVPPGAPEAHNTQPCQCPASSCLGPAPGHCPSPSGHASQGGGDARAGCRLKPLAPTTCSMAPNHIRPGPPPGTARPQQSGGSAPPQPLRVPRPGPGPHHLSCGGERVRSAPAPPHTACQLCHQPQPTVCAQCKGHGVGAQDRTPPWGCLQELGRPSQLSPLPSSG